MACIVFYAVAQKCASLAVRFYKAETFNGMHSVLCSGSEMC